jgi:hypothetical protein
MAQRCCAGVRVAGIKPETLPQSPLDQGPWARDLETDIGMGV